MLTSEIVLSGLKHSAGGSPGKSGFITYHLTSYGFFSHSHVASFRIEGVNHHIRRWSTVIPLFLFS